MRIPRPMFSRVLGQGDHAMNSTARWSWKSLVSSTIIYCSVQENRMSFTTTYVGDYSENRMGAARTTILFLWSIREKGQKLCWSLGLHCLRPGTPDLGNTTRIQTHGFSPRVFFTCMRKTARIRPNCDRTITKTQGANPSVASLNIWICNFPFRKHQFSALWDCSVPLREHQASGAWCASSLPYPITPTVTGALSG